MRFHSIFHKRRAWIAVPLAAIAFGGCGSSDETKTVTVTEGDDESGYVEDDAYEEESYVEDTTSMTPAELLAGSEMEWANIDDAQKAAVARAFMVKYRKAYPRATGGMLLAEANDGYKNSIFATTDTGQTLEQALKFMAQLAESSALFAAKDKYLPSKRVVGMPTSEVKRLLGPPDNEQDIAGQVMWYYNLGDNMYQLTVSAGTVTGLNKY